MNVLILHSRYLAGSVSGENRVVEDDTLLLREAGHEVTLWDPVPDLEITFGSLRAGLRAMWSFKALGKLNELVASSRPDVIHVHNLFPQLSPAVIRLAASKQIPSVMTLHNYRLMCLPADLFRDNEICEACIGKIPWRGIMFRCYRDSVPASMAMASSISIHRASHTFDRITLFLAVSGFVRDKHLQAGFPEEKFVIRPNFAWPQTQRQGPGTFYLYLGRISDNKGVEILARAWRKRKQGTLVVAGDGPGMNTLRSLQLERVSVLGAVHPRQATDLLLKARALLVPSICYEGSPRSVIEAFASGVPVIGSRLGGVAEILNDGVNGILVEPRDPESLTEGLSVLDSDDVSINLGQGARRTWSNKYTPEQALVSLETAYSRAMDEYRT